MSDIQALREQLSRVIVGQHTLLDRLITALLAGGHVLLEGPPGLAKTTAVHALASGLKASFQRIQFTPDLLPGDLTGSEVYEPDKGGFHFVPGPVFHEVILADEINRAPPKVQSALLEAMAEHQVTAGGHTHPLPPLFMVLATQNPLEHSGTYPLPEAQLDRFLLHLVIGFPTPEEEVEIARRALRAPEGHVDRAIEAVLTPEALLDLRRQVDAVFIEPSLERYAVDLVAATRDIGRWKPEWSGRISAGASPRASIALLRCAMARAFIDGRDFILPEDIHELAHDVLRHRMVLDFSAQAEGLSADRIVDGLLDAVPAP